MNRSSSKFDFYLFVDDTNLLYAEKDLDKLEVVINEVLLKLYEWLFFIYLYAIVRYSPY